MDFEWNTLDTNVATYIQICLIYARKKLAQRVVLYMAMVTPKWDCYIVKHVKGTQLGKPRHRKYAIIDETNKYELIEGKLNKIGLL